MSKNKVSPKTDNKVLNSSEEENVKIDPENDTEVVNIDENGNNDELIEEIVENQKKEIQELKDQLLRSLADSENLRKRTMKEIADAKRYSHISFVRDLVSSVDNLQRALKSLPEDKSQLSEPVKNLIIGLEIVEKEIINTFEKHNLKEISPLDEKFDYNLHQAMFEVPTNENEPGYVVEVSQKGYLLHDRLVRPAMVGISKKSEEEITDQNNKKNEQK